MARNRMYLQKLLYSRSVGNIHPIIPGDEEGKDSSPTLKNTSEEVVESEEQECEETSSSLNVSTAERPRTPLFMKLVFTCLHINIQVEITILCPHRTPLCKKRKRSLTTVDELELEILRELKQSKSETASADEDDLFGQSIAATLKKLPPQQKALAKVKMQNLLYEVQFCTPQLPPAAEHSISVHFCLN